MAYLKRYVKNLVAICGTYGFILLQYLRNDFSFNSPCLVLKHRSGMLSGYWGWNKIIIHQLRYFKKTEAVFQNDRDDQLNHRYTKLKIIVVGFSDGLISKVFRLLWSWDYQKSFIQMLWSFPVVFKVGYIKHFAIFLCVLVQVTAILQTITESISIYIQFYVNIHISDDTL